MSALAPDLKPTESDPRLAGSSAAQLFVIERGQRDRFAAAIATLEEAVRSGAIPGGVLGVVRGGTIELLVGRGVKWSSAIAAAAGSECTISEEANQVDLNTIYDLGNLTSNMVTVPLLMKLEAAGQLKLDERVSRYLQGFGVHGKSTVTIEMLLSHAAGFPSTAPFYEELALASHGERIGILTTRGAKQYVYTSLHRFEPKYVPGSKRIHSELDSIVLGELLETLKGTTLDRLAQKEIFQPLNLRSTSFVDLGMMKRRGIHPVRDMIAPTDMCPWRRRVMCGEAFNENAWAMGGISGHAGLFASAHDVAAVAIELLRALNGRGSVLEGQTVHRFVAPLDAEHGVRLGWESPTKDNGLNESGLSADSFGATSETGCSLWIDRTKELAIVLLSNRIDVGRNNKALKLARADIIREVMSVVP